MRRAVRGMLPKNTLGRQQLAKLKVYAGPDHPHEAQQPERARDPRRAPDAPLRRNAMPVPLTQTTGRRKQAVARVRFRPGDGKITINRRAFEEYFTSATHRMVVTDPLRLTNTAESYDIDATIDGGGVSGQASALRLGHRPQPVRLDPELRPR